MTPEQNVCQLGKGFQAETMVWHVLGTDDKLLGTAMEEFGQCTWRIFFFLICKEKCLYHSVSSWMNFQKLNTPV